MTKLQTIASVVVGIIISVLISSGLAGNPQALVAGVYEQVAPYFYKGFYAGESNQFSISNSGAVTSSGAITTTGALSSGALTSTADGTIQGGTLTVTTSNTATSTITGGCFQFYASSTETPHKFQASTTPGIMYSDWGACPNL